MDGLHEKEEHDATGNRDRSDPAGDRRGGADRRRRVPRGDATMPLVQTTTRAARSSGWSDPATTAAGGWGFFPFGFLLFPLFLFGFIFLMRGLFWGRRWGGPGGPGGVRPGPRLGTRRPDVRGLAPAPARTVNRRSPLGRRRAGVRLADAAGQRTSKMRAHFDFGGAGAALPPPHLSSTLHQRNERDDDDPGGRGRDEDRAAGARLPGRRRVRGDRGRRRRRRGLRPRTGRSPT